MKYHTNINGIDVDADFNDISVRDIFIPLLKHLSEMQSQKNRRILVMLAAPPGAGKSTLSGFLELLAKDVIPGKKVQAIGMDGFHRRQEYLVSHTTTVSDREVCMVDIKGAPVTFDLDRLKEKIAEVAAGKVCGWPRYDRLLHNPVEDAINVDGDIIILEGNYLLLDEDGWNELADNADYTISITADPEMLRSRLLARQISSGKEPEHAEKFVDFSDMTNVRMCLKKTKAADLELKVYPGLGFVQKSDRKLELFLQQKDTLDKFLSNGAISPAQYDKSYGDLTIKMGMEEVAKELSETQGSNKKMKNAYFAGGCFWCVTPVYKMYGVQNVICGYSGGDEENPTYEDVKAQKTGHRETIMLTYDPAKVSYEKLLDIYFANVDPFDAEGQFIDRGFSYTLAIFYTDDKEKELAQKRVEELEDECGESVKIAILPFRSFYKAEDYHQDYYLKNPEAFERKLIESGRKKE